MSPPKIILKYLRWLKWKQMDSPHLNQVRSQLLDESKLDMPYLILIISSCMIATFGLLSNSTAVIIGAMLVAPLMLPIRGLAFGALVTRAWGCLLGVFTAFLVLGLFREAAFLAGAGFFFFAVARGWRGFEGLDSISMPKMLLRSLSSISDEPSAVAADCKSSELAACAIRSAASTERNWKSNSG